MSKPLENLWVSWLNSDRWRQFAKSRIGAKLLRSNTYQRINVVRRYVTTYYKSRRHPALFQDIKTFCMFIGHVKSGGTLIGSLLDAHPNIILADEVDVLGYISTGFRKDQIYHLLLKGSRREAMKGRVTARRLTPYSFAIPGQWQGKYCKLQVIGASKAGPSTRRLSTNPAMLQKLEYVMKDIDIKFIHVIRNPYDPISAMMVRGKRTFRNAIDHYFDYCETLTGLGKQLNSANLLRVRYEEFIHQPKIHLENICRFLGIEANEAYLNACTQILYETPEQARHMVEWESPWIETVQKKIDQFDFLAGYTFDR